MNALLEDTELLREGDGMTDYQFKAIIKMVLSIAREAKDPEKIIEELERLLPENERGGH